MLKNLLLNLPPQTVYNWSPVLQSGHHYIPVLCLLERLPDLRCHVRPRRRERPQERDERMLIGGDPVTPSVGPELSTI